MRQEFHRGDLVWVRDEYWNDFGAGAGRTRTPAHYAIIVGSYRDQYGGSEYERHIYTQLVLDEKGQPLYRSSWLNAELIEILVVPRCIENLDLIDFYETGEDNNE